uniref:VWFC domain-containing protein n=1 Tax=Knipowitschia caucasica TaxID=637954 RepID=A0AAV2KJU3_KNICA
MSHGGRRAPSGSEGVGRHGLDAVGRRTRPPPPVGTGARAEAEDKVDPVPEERTMPPGPGFLRLLRVLPLLLAPGPRVSAEISSKPEDYEFGDYRGKWCLDESGYVYAIGQVYSPSPFACPCTCTEDGPLCVRPTCPRVHPRCTRIRYKGCCPVCEAMARVCVYGGRTYRPLEEFWVSRCEHCRCGANREVYCSISDCPAPHLFLILCVYVSVPHPLCQCSSSSVFMSVFLILCVYVSVPHPLCLLFLILCVSVPHPLCLLFLILCVSVPHPLLFLILCVSVPHPLCKCSSSSVFMSVFLILCCSSSSVSVFLIFCVSVPHPLCQCSSSSVFMSVFLILCVSVPHPLCPNCFVGSRIIEAGERVIVDDTVCFCTYREGSWHTLPYATCEEQQLNTELPEAHRDQDSSQDSGQDSGQGRGYSPRLHLIP